MNETIVKFGNVGHLIGILNSGSESADAPVALLFNAGFLHRVGPFRLWVDLARKLAEHNVPSLRFDLEGLGDSGAVSDESDSVKRAIESLKAAMDCVESKIGKREFILFGLCSGADYGHPAAKADPRIRGMVFIDAFGYRTKSYFVNHHFKRLTSGRRWKNLIKRKLSRNKPAAEAFATTDVREFPPAEQVENDILSFLEQGRRLYYIYTAGVFDYYSHAGQFWKMFPRLKPQRGLHCDYYKTSDHTFSLVNDRADLSEKLVRFATSWKAP